MTEAEALAYLRVITDSKEEDFTPATWDSFLAAGETVDSEGRRPYETGYVPTWDLNRSASVVWTTKAARLARTAFDMQTDMTKANRSGQIDNAFKMARKFAALSRAEIIKHPNQSSVTEAGDNVSPDA